MYAIGAYIAIAEPTKPGNVSDKLSSGGIVAMFFFYLWTVFYSPTWNGTVSSCMLSCDLGAHSATLALGLWSRSVPHLHPSRHSVLCCRFQLALRLHHRSFHSADVQGDGLWRLLALRFSYGYFHFLRLRKSPSFLRIHYSDIQHGISSSLSQRPRTFSSSVWTSSSPPISSRGRHTLLSSSDSVRRKILQIFQKKTPLWSKNWLTRTTRSVEITSSTFKVRGPRSLEKGRVFILHPSYDPLYSMA